MPLCFITLIHKSLDDSKTIYVSKNTPFSVLGSMLLLAPSVIGQIWVSLSTVSSFFLLLEESTYFSFYL
jgi:hypothetical protein